MLTLPAPRPAYLKSFWLVTSLSLMVAGILFLPVRFPWGLGGCALGAGTLVWIGMRWPVVASKPYRVYNLVAGRVARMGSFAVMGVCFYLVVVALGRQGATLQLSHPGAMQSSWVPRLPLAREAYHSQFSHLMTHTSQTGWITELCLWAFRPGNRWACWVLPFVVLLWLFDDGREHEVPADIYTLF
ncbi:MAG: hypothetical protein AB7G75_05145 [Candidatus Binatia bacterium]